VKNLKNYSGSTRKLTKVEIFGQYKQHGKEEQKEVQKNICPVSLWRKLADFPRCSRVNVLSSITEKIKCTYLSHSN
jgi:hypothetical protein